MTEARACPECGHEMAPKLWGIWVCEGCGCAICRTAVPTHCKGCRRYIFTSRGWECWYKKYDMTLALRLKGALCNPTGFCVMRRRRKE